EPERLRGPLWAGERPALVVRRRRLGSRAPLVHEQRHVEPDSAQWAPGPRDLECELEMGLEALCAERRLEPLAELAVRDDVQARLGDSLADHGLWRRNQQEGLLQPTSLVHAPPLLDNALCV